MNKAFFVFIFFAILAASPVRKEQIRNSSQQIKNGKNSTAPSDTSEPSDSVLVDKRPVPLKKIMPRFLPGLPGIKPGHDYVWVKMLVGIDGNVRKVVVMKSDDPILDQYAIEAAMRWQFAPAVVNQKSVASWFTYGFRFRSYVNN